MTEQPSPKIGLGSYLIAGFGFVPFLGIPFAALAILIGIVKRAAGKSARRVLILGYLGMLLTMSIYGLLYYEMFAVRGGFYDHLRQKDAVAALGELIKELEYYKLQNGKYPETLVELKGPPAKDSVSYNTIYDPTVIDGPPQMFFYQTTPDGKHYYLLSSGTDKIPFTADDIVPQLSPHERAKTGLLIKPGSGTAQVTDKQ